MPALFSGRTKSIAAAVILILGLPMAAFSFSPPAKPAGEAPAASAESEAPAADGTFQGFPITELMDVALLEGANIERGHTVFQRSNCLSCHGWDGNGMNKNPRSEGNAAKLRNSQLDTQGFMDIIRCGIPGTPMPFHDSQAYKNPDVCFGQVLADFDPADEPRKGKTFRQPDLVNLVAYIQTHVQGAGETTLEQCQDFFGASAATACTNLE